VTLKDIKKRAGSRALGQAIARERIRQGVSQQMLGERLGLSQPTISRYEHGKVTSHTDLALVFRKLCRMRWKVSPSKARRRRS
jgi:transcriptional regulator with XRE-family HTH domain